jgi:flagellin-specific chaperone FliS
MIDREAYTLRIAQATPVNLVIITFELTSAYIREALEENGGPEFIRNRYDMAKRGIMQLISGLDFAQPFANGFYDIYLYVYELLVRADITLKQAPAEEALSLLNQLLISWRVAVKEEKAAPVGDAPTVYAGLTYERGGLAEYVAEEDVKEFKA